MSLNWYIMNRSFNVLRDHEYLFKERWPELGIPSGYRTTIKGPESDKVSSAHGLTN